MLSFLGVYVLGDRPLWSLKILGDRLTVGQRPLKPLI